MPFVELFAVFIEQLFIVGKFRIIETDEIVGCRPHGITTGQSFLE
jgi:hypothetical protein